MFTLPATAQNIIDTLEKAGHEAYAVGGSVRDLLMKRPTSGWDFTTDATPEQILKLFPDSFYDNRFGTVGVKIKDEAGKTTDIYEVTTYRSEQGYSDFRHPDTVLWGKSLEEDLSRRDFTINAIAYNGKEFKDPFGGRQDIKAKIIKSVGRASDRFSEDALRMLRAIRIAAQLGFLVEEQTRAAISEHAGLIKNISAERVSQELMKLFQAPYAADGILMLKNTGLLKIIIPELDACFGVNQKSPRRHHIFDVGTHLVQALKFCPSPDPLVRFATLLHDIGKADTYKVNDNGVITFYNHEVIGAKKAKRIAERFRFSKHQIERIYTLVRWHQFSVDERQTDSAIRRFIRRVGRENLEDMLALRIGDRLGGGARETSWRLELFKSRLEEVQRQPFSVTDLTINGHDVMEIFGIKPGPLVGQVLSLIFGEVESGRLPNDREVLLKKVRELKLEGTGSAQANSTK